MPSVLPHRLGAAFMGRPKNLCLLHVAVKDQAQRELHLP